MQCNLLSREGHTLAFDVSGALALARLRASKDDVWPARRLCAMLSTVSARVSERESRYLRYKSSRDDFRKISKPALTQAEQHKSFAEVVEVRQLDDKAAWASDRPPESGGQLSQARQRDHQRDRRNCRFTCRCSASKASLNCRRGGHARSSETSTGRPACPALAGHRERRSALYEACCFPKPCWRINGRASLGRKARPKYRSDGHTGEAVHLYILAQFFY